VFIDTTDKTITTAMNTEHITVISIITLNRHLCTHVFSTLGSYPWHRSRTQYFTDSLHHWATNYAVPQLRSPLTVVHTHYPLYATHWFAVRRRLSNSPRSLPFFAFLQSSTLFQPSMDTTTMFCPLRVREGSGNLDVTGFVGHHTTRRCCSRLQYIPNYLAVSV